MQVNYLKVGRVYAYPLDQSASDLPANSIASRVAYNLLASFPVSQSKLIRCIPDQHVPMPH